MKLVFLLGLCSLAPLLMDLYNGDPISAPTAISAIAVALLSIYSGYQQVMGNRSTTLLHDKQQLIEKLLLRLGSDVSDGQDQVSRLSLDPSVRDDTSEAGVAWKRIHGKTTRQYYDQFLANYPSSLYVAEAEKRLSDIRNWERVDHNDPFDVHFFLLSNPFEALRKLAESSMREAILKSNAENRRQFWRQVGIPFHVLLPLIPLAYVIVGVAVMGLYQLAGHAFFAPSLKVCIGFVRESLEKLETHQYYSTIQPAATWVAQHIELITRIALTGILGIAVLYLLIFIIAGIGKQWVGPRITAINAHLDEQNTSRFEAVL